MNQTSRTGVQIFNEIERCQGELVELNRALVEIEERTLPYRLLDAERTKKVRELNELKNREYTA